jgi:hypothetical protein
MTCDYLVFWIFSVVSMMGAMTSRAEIITDKKLSIFHQLHQIVLQSQPLTTTSQEINNNVSKL